MRILPNIASRQCFYLKYRKIVMALSLLMTSLVISGCAKFDGSGEPKSPSGSDPSEFSGKPGDCRKFIESLPKDYFHEWIDVSEEPNTIAGPTIHVFFYGKITDPNNVILFYNGGPASDSHGNHIAFEREMKRRHSANRYSFVHMDQRGTGCSTVYPQGKTDDIIKRLRWYGSTGIVYDSEAIRKKLVGEKKWKIFGQSYGAFIVHRYVSLFPQFIDKAYAHANAINSDPMERLKGRIYSQHRVMGLYLETYPDDRVRFEKLKKELGAGICFTTDHSGPICGHEVLVDLVSYLGFSNRWSDFHNLIGKFVNEVGINRESIQDFVAEVHEDDDPATYAAMSVIGFYDRNVAPMNTENCQLVYESLKRNGIGADQFLLNECLDALQTPRLANFKPHVQSVLNNVQDVLTLANFKQGLLQMAPMSFFLYSGERDSFVPKENFIEELAQIEKEINYVHFMTSGHEGYRTEDQVWQDLLK